MNNEKQSKEKPTFKPWTPEEKAELEMKNRELARKMTEDMKNGIYPVSTMETHNFSLKDGYTLKEKKE